jgi:hypothetical protein
MVGKYSIDSTEGHLHFSFFLAVPSGTAVPPRKLMVLRFASAFFMAKIFPASNAITRSKVPSSTTNVLALAEPPLPVLVV